MIKKIDRNKKRLHRHNRVRNKISGTSERPRLVVFRSNANISVQVIDDSNHTTLVSANSHDLKLANGGNIEAAKAVGEAVAQRALEANIKTVVFDRGGYLFHGRVKALADAARQAGLEF